MHSTEQPGFPRFLLGLGLALLAAIGVTGGLYLKHQQTELRQTVQHELAAIADLKVQQIVNWRNERLSDARFFSKAAFVARSVQAFLHNPESAQTRIEVLNWLDLLKGGKRYAKVLLFDAQLRLRLALPEQPNAPILDGMIEQVRSALQSRQTKISDLHRDPGKGDIHLSILFPLFPPHASSADPTVSPLGVILLQLDPHQFLYPLIQTWPMPSRTAETLIIRREGDQIVYLNELRHVQGAALKLRLPAADPVWRLPAALAVQGNSQVVEGRDYRREPVLAALRPIPDTPWFMVAKVDQQEIYAALRKQAAFTSAIIVTLMLTAGLGVALIWRQRDTLWLQRQLAMERERQALAERIEHLLKHANDIILILDADTRIVEANDRALQSYGYSLDELRQLKVAELRPPETLETLGEQLKQAHQREGIRFETVHRRRDGSAFPVEVSSRVIDSGDAGYFLSIIRDITERKAHEQEIERLNRLYAALSQVNQAVVRATSQQMLCEEVCRVLIEFGGFSLAWIGWHDSQTRQVTPFTQYGDSSGYLREIQVRTDDSPLGQGLIGCAIREGRPHVSNDLHRDPRTAPWREAASKRDFQAIAALPVRIGGEVRGALVIYARERGFFGEKEIALLEEAALDIAFGLDHLEQAERVQHLAYYDALTDLPNRMLLRERAAQTLARAHRDKTDVALLFLDLDHFKNINDSLGHSVGDQLLQAVAARLKQAVRETDTVSRLGGDEFLLILAETGPESAAQVAQKILNLFAQPFMLDSLVLHLATSIGISLYPRDAHDFESLLRYADAALYRAKESGRNAFHFFRPEMNAAALERLALESALRQALARGELELHYQPQIALDSGRLVGFESLIRWRHPEWGLVSPARFIPVAEHSGLIVEIGVWVLREACRQNRVWQMTGLFQGLVAVNLSAVQIRQGHLAPVVQQILTETALPAQTLELEVTESLLVDPNDNVMDQFRQLKGLGVKFSIDDFGTGYSNLSYLKRFPIDKLKIDQSFVRDIAHDPDDLAIASAIVSMGHSLRLTVIAEGVENDRAVGLLRDIACDEAQGYRIARPMPAAEVPTWLSGYNGLRIPPED